jgi:hypothetical protein
MTFRAVKQAVGFAEQTHLALTNLDGQNLVCALKAKSDFSLI